MRRALWTFALSVQGACASAQIPYPLEDAPRATQARHAIRVAVLPFADERDSEDTRAEDGLFSYGGLDYEPTDLSELAAPPGFVMAEILARHLVRVGSFREVLLVRDPSQAPEAELLLRGRIRRARGYVEADGQREARPNQVEVRRVIAEVFISDVELVEPGANGRRLLHADLGWSILEERPLSPERPSPWQVLGDALFESHRQLALLLEDAVLDGSFVAPEETALAATTGQTSSAAIDLARLGAMAPAGWAFEPGSAPSGPEGWRASSTCEAGQFAALQTQRFHRVLGPYRPTVRVWLCPAELELALDHKIEFPAKYLGRAPSGESVFSWRLGPSSWPRAESDLARALRVEGPSGKYTFKVGPKEAATTRQ